MKGEESDELVEELVVDLDVLTRLYAARDSARLALASEGEDRGHEQEAFAHFDEAARLLHEGLID